MNIHVELAKKYLADNDSVTLKELEANEEDARAAYDDARAALAAYWAAKTARAAKAAYWAAKAAYWAAKAARVADDTVDDDFWAAHFKQQAIKAVKEYEELTK